MRNPCAVVAIAGLALLVGADLGESFLVGYGIGLDGDICGHAAHGVDVAVVAGLDGQLGIAAHEVRGHGDLAAIGKDGVRVAGKFLDEAEDVIPAAAVEAGGVLAQLVEISSISKLARMVSMSTVALDGAVGNAEVFLRADEDVVPEAGFKMALQLGQVEVRAAAAREQLFGVVKEVEAEVEDGAGHGLAVDEDMLLDEMPTAGANEEDGDFVVELVLLLPWRGRSR